MQAQILNLMRDLQGRVHWSAEKRHCGREADASFSRDPPPKGDNFEYADTAMLFEQFKMAGLIAKSLR